MTLEELLTAIDVTNDTLRIYLDNCNNIVITEHNLEEVTNLNVRLLKKLKEWLDEEVAVKEPDSDYTEYPITISTTLGNIG